MNAAMRKLMRSPQVIRALALAAVCSVLGVGGTALALVAAAQAIAGALIDGQPPTLTLGLEVLAGLGLRALGGAGREYVGGELAARQVAQMRAGLAGAALGLGPVLLAGKRGSDLAALDSELHRFRAFFGRFLPNSVHAAVSVPMLLAATLWLDPATALLLAVTGPLTIVFLYLVGLATAKATEEQWLAHTRLGARVVTLIRHLPTLHAFGAAAPYREVLQKSAEAHEQSTYRVLKIAFLSGFVMEFAGTLSTALIAVWIGVRLFGGEAELAPTLAALMLVAEFFGPLRQMGADRHAAMDAEPLAERWQALVETPLAPSGMRRVSGGISLRLESAHADLAGAHLAPVCAQIAAGEHAALRGPSGSGKSSLLHALYGSVPYVGQLEVNGIPLRELEREAWQAGVAYVPQHPRLVAGSVWDNLRLSRPEAAPEEVQAAADAVGLGRVLGELPHGFHTLLGEGGVQLSGGETARLALGRALLSGAPLVLLDEVTAHLDPHTEAEILGVIERAFVGCTVLLATHRAVPTGWREVRLEAAALPAQRGAA